MVDIIIDCLVHLDYAVVFCFKYYCLEGLWKFYRFEQVENVIHITMWNFLFQHTLSIIYILFGILQWVFNICSRRELSNFEFFKLALSMFIPFRNGRIVQLKDSIKPPNRWVTIFFMSILILVHSIIGLTFCLAIVPFTLGLIHFDYARLFINIMFSFSLQKGYQRVSVENSPLN